MPYFQKPENALKRAVGKHILRPPHMQHRKIAVAVCLHSDHTLLLLCVAMCAQHLLLLCSLNFQNLKMSDSPSWRGIRLKSFLIAKSIAVHGLLCTRRS